MPCRTGTLDDTEGRRKTGLTEDEKKLKKQETPREEKTDWHTAFQSAMELELRANKTELTYQREYELTKQPMRIDFLVIKKNSDVKIKNEIGQIFRRYNIMEYKSPDDDLTIDTFFKVLGYGCIYKAETGHKVDEIPARELTISFVRERKPRKMMHMLQESGCAVEMKFPGIYYVSGSVFPVQIIVGRELSEKSHICLKALTRNLTLDQKMELVEESRELNEKDDKLNLASVLEVIVKENRTLFQKGENDMAYETLMELLSDKIEEKVQEEKRQSFQDGEERLSDLQKALLHDGRRDDVERVIYDTAFRKQLYQEYGLTRSKNQADKF